MNDKFIKDDISKAVYDQTLERYMEEKTGILEQLKKMQIKLSNLEEFVDYSFKIGPQLPSLWKKSDLKGKKQFQNLVFPDGLGFNKEKDDYRTLRVNTFFKAIDYVSGKLAENKSGISESDIENSAEVARTRITTFDLLLHSLTNSYIAIVDSVSQPIKNVNQCKSLRPLLRPLIILHHANESHPKVLLPETSKSKWYS